MSMVLVMVLSLMQLNQHKRIVDIYTNDAHNQHYKEQLQLLKADPEGMKERDLVIREHLKATTFKATLTGKDGGEKYSSTKVLTLKKLYALVDAMPMRREEMKKQ